MTLIHTPTPALSAKNECIALPQPHYAGYLIPTSFPYLRQDQHASPSRCSHPAAPSSTSCERVRHSTVVQPSQRRARRVPHHLHTRRRHRRCAAERDRPPTVGCRICQLSSKHRASKRKQRVGGIDSDESDYICSVRLSHGPPPTLPERHGHHARFHRRDAPKGLHDAHLAINLQRSFRLVSRAKRDTCRRDSRGARHQRTGRSAQLSAVRGQLGVQCCLLGCKWKRPHLGRRPSYSVRWEHCLDVSRNLHTECAVAHGQEYRQFGQVDGANSVEWTDIPRVSAKILCYIPSTISPLTMTIFSLAQIPRRAVVPFRCDKVRQLPTSL